MKTLLQFLQHDIRLLFNTALKKLPTYFKSNRVQQDICHLPITQTHSGFMDDHPLSSFVQYLLCASEERINAV
jgi:hypothetical protein